MKVWISILELLILLKNITKITPPTRLPAAQKLDVRYAHSPIGRLTLARQTFFCGKKSRVLQNFFNSEFCGLPQKILTKTKFTREKSSSSLALGKVFELPLLTLNRKSL